ncbi:endonuclease, partial [Candidatus Azambacteria bacterium]|nr:endonuclease [Candidatus Azambacteria bacterium]
MQRIGVHVSIAGGIDKAPERARALGCNTFQFFSRPPRGGPRPMISLEVAEFFKKKCAEYDLQPTFIHTPYFIHLA